jgi:molybdopterin-guanine dinucleotide biosynthesis protein A
LSDDVVISCNRNQELYRPYADQWLAMRADFPGPLAGVIAGLTVARHEWWCCWRAMRPLG